MSQCVLTVKSVGKPVPYRDRDGSTVINPMDALRSQRSNQHVASSISRLQYPTSNQQFQQNLFSNNSPFNSGTCCTQTYSPARRLQNTRNPSPPSNGPILLFNSKLTPGNTQTMFASFVPQSTGTTAIIDTTASGPCGQRFSNSFVGGPGTRIQ